ncbi:amidase domain-containing protein [Bacillaceae bacterium Marseille-Q3522]|nr:amidase domain-containing protein [Bacillaceae bacterium Marseille-Q3522]
MVLAEVQKPISELVSDDGSIQESKDLFVAENSAMAELSNRRDVLKQWGETYSHSITELTIQNTDIKDNVVVLDIEEYTKLFYKKVRGDEPEYTAWVSERQFVFEKGNSSWKLVSQKLLDDSGPAPINEPTGKTKEEMNYALSKFFSNNDNNDTVLRELNNFKTTDKIDIQGTFNHGAARDYAKRYWNNYNPSYRVFGNDCTNFISQAMRAGGWLDVSGFYRDSHYWWYNHVNQTWSWVGVPYWYDFAANKSKRTILLSSPRSLWDGEVLQADFTNNGSKDHTMIVTRKTALDIYLTYHTNDTFERSFASISVSYPSARWIPHMLKINY